MNRLGFAIVTTLALAGPQGVLAQEVLTIGVRSEAATLDPHWTQLSSDLQLQEHILNILSIWTARRSPRRGLPCPGRPLMRQHGNSSCVRASAGTMANRSLPMMSSIRLTA